jgi:histone chaperone ASF1
MDVYREVLIAQTPAPDQDKIPKNEIIGVTVLLVTCSYRGKEFTRIGYYVNNDYANAEM